MSTEKTLHEVLLADGTSIVIEESPKYLVGEWVTVQTYTKVYNILEARTYLKGRDWLSIRPSMIVGFKTVMDCKVIG